LARKGYPWAPLVKLVFSPELRPSEEDSFYLRIEKNSKESLRSIFTTLKEEANELVRNLSARGVAVTEVKLDTNVDLQMIFY